ncbi:hypothetical protein BpHYR1_028786 [Brachionus plicatilis]|uniref:Uncharacterized protein n=1 Tax=Brachionus plicatilis TaxID=10195 RepID=A0A3M7RSX1_BRAPC|nr:hypothetical protein BpHYR1_028786 [Brachionus plicatilis]
MIKNVYKYLLGRAFISFRDLSEATFLKYCLKNNPVYINHVKIITKLEFPKITNNHHSDVHTSY